MSSTNLGGDPRRLITHMAFYGLAAICEQAGHSDLRLSWSGGMRPGPSLNIAPDLIGEIISAHTGARHWVKETISVGGTPRGLMSPRLGAIGDDAAWAAFQGRRQAVLDDLTEDRAELDLRFLGALGEPCYWRYDSTGKQRRQDDAASRLEMQARNQGSELIGTRLSRIADIVAARTHTAIVDGLASRRIRDELGKDEAGSRSATGMDAYGPADNAVVWCALWGISQNPLALRTASTAVTSTAIPAGPNPSHFFVPLWNGDWHPARLRSILASHQLRSAAQSVISADAPEEAHRSWLTDRGVTAVIAFPIIVGGSQNAPERRAGLGRLFPLAGRR